MILKDLCQVDGQMEVLSGLRIGGSDDMLQIGGTDLTFIRDPASGLPYVPGSSIKGRMRAALESALGKGDSEPCRCAQRNCPICVVFGPHQKAKHELGPTRLIVHDGLLVPGCIPVFESKTESVNNRSTGAAKNPRTLERIAPGARFVFRLGIKFYDLDEKFSYDNKDKKPVTGKDALLEVVYHAMDLLETMGLGAGTGKGYGEIRIVGDKSSWGGLQRRRSVNIVAVPA